MAEVVSQRIGNELTRLYAVMNEVANRAVVTCDDIQYGLTAESDPAT